MIQRLVRFWGRNVDWTKSYHMVILQQAAQKVERLGADELLVLGIHEALPTSPWESAEDLKSR